MSNLMDARASLLNLIEHHLSPATLKSLSATFEREPTDDDARDEDGYRTPGGVTITLRINCPEKKDGD